MNDVSKRALAGWCVSVPGVGGELVTTKAGDMSQGFTVTCHTIVVTCHSEALYLCHIPELLF